MSAFRPSVEAICLSDTEAKLPYDLAKASHRSGFGGQLRPCRLGLGCRRRVQPGQELAERANIDGLAEILGHVETARRREPARRLPDPAVLAADDDQLPGEAAFGEGTHEGQAVF